MMAHQHESAHHDHGNPESDKGNDEAFSKLHKLYPRLRAEDLQIAEENLDRYVELALRMYERIIGDPEAYAQFKALTASARHPTMNSERSNEQ